MITYSYGKQLLAPGQRIGYLTVPPTMPDREAFRETIFVAQLATGYAFPNALLQHAIEDLERLSIDIGAMQARSHIPGAAKDRMYLSAPDAEILKVILRLQHIDIGTQPRE